MGFCSRAGCQVAGWSGSFRLCLNFGRHRSEGDGLPGRVVLSLSKVGGFAGSTGSPFYLRLEFSLVAGCGKCLVLRLEWVYVGRYR